MTTIDSKSFGTLLGILSGIFFTGAAMATEAVWDSRSATGNWSDTTKWRDGYKPASDGSDSVLMPSVSTSTGYYLYIDEPASVSGIKYNQSTGGAQTPSIAASGNGKLTLGAGGISTDYNDSGTERLPNIDVPVELSSSQKWEFNFKGMNNTDWLSKFKDDVSGASDVIWTLAGGKWTFESGSSSNFLGKVYVQNMVVLKDISQFNRLGSDIYLVNTNCFGVTTTIDPQIRFYYRDAGGKGTVDSVLHFDTDITVNKAVGLGIPMLDPEKFSETVFRGAWSGRVHAERFVVEGSGDRYGYGVIAYEGGLLSPDACVLRFENDMSALSTYVKQGVSFNSLIWVVANPKAIGGGQGGKYYVDASSEASTTDCGFRIGAGRAGRIQGLLATPYAAVSNTYIRMSTGNDNNRAITLFGSTGSGYAEFRSVIQIDGITSTGELPFWLYSEPEGTCRFTASFTYHNGGKRYLPVNIWGGGTVILSCDQWTLGEQKHPFWVRDGRFVVGGSGTSGAPGIQVQDVQVGVSHPKSFTVRAVTMGYLKGVDSAAYDANTQKVVFSSSAYKPDGVTLQVGDKVLVNCPAGSVSTRGSIYNGIYEVTGALEWTRVADFNEPDEMIPDTRVDVLEGNRYAGTRWFLSNEGYREHARRGTAQVMPFNSHDNTPVFLPEKNKNPDVALLVEGTRSFPNKVTVVDNQSTGISELGAYTENTTVSFTGPITIEKSAVTFTAPFEAACSFTGAVTGEVAVAKSGAGEVVLAPTDGDFTVTNVTVAAGRLTLAPALLKNDLKTACFDWSSGTSAELNFTGDIDLSDWTIELKGVPAGKIAKGEEPAPFSFSILSAGTITGTPTITGVPESRWVLSGASGQYTLSYVRPGLILSVH